MSGVNVARAVWQFGEPVHAVTYYAPERREATDALGLEGGWIDLARIQRDHS